MPQSQAVEETVERVIARLRRRRVRRALVWGGAAITATIIGTVSGLLPSSKFSPQLAQNTLTKQAQPTKTIAAATLNVSINNPILPIPKAAETTPEDPFNRPKQLPALDIGNEYH